MVLIYFYDDTWNPDPAGLNWRGGSPAEAGAGSVVVAAAWVRWKAWWGNSTFKIVAWDVAKPIGEADPSKDYWQLPAAARSFTCEGRRAHSGVIPAVSLLQQAK